MAKEKRYKYKQTTHDRIIEMVSTDDYTVREIAEAVKINPDTHYEWLKTIPAFKEAIEAAEETRFQTFRKAARRGLLTLLNGKEFEEITTDYVEGKEGEPKIKSLKKVKKFIMPNPTSVLFTLKNLDPQNFKDIFSNEHTGKDGGPINHKIQSTVTFNDMTE